MLARMIVKSPLDVRTSQWAVAACTTTDSSTLSIVRVMRPAMLKLHTKAGVFLTPFHNPVETHSSSLAVEWELKL